MQIKLFLIQV